MGGCNSIVCSDSEFVKNHRRHNAMRFKQAASTIPKASSSIKVMDIKSSNTDESSTNSSSSCSSSLSDSGSYIDLPSETLESLKVRGTPWPPRADIDSRQAKQRSKSFSSGSEKDCQSEKGSEADLRDSSPKEPESAPPAPVRHFRYTGYTAPLPRPSPWKQVYLTMIKPKEEEAEETMKKKEKWSREKRKRIRREEEVYDLRRALSGYFDSLLRIPSFFRRRNTPDALVEGQSPLGVRDYHDYRDHRDFLSEDGSSTTVSPASTSSSSSATSQSISLKSEDSFDEIAASISLSYGDDESKVSEVPSTSLNQGKKSAGKLFGLISRKRNKVSPL